MVSYSSFSAIELPASQMTDQQVWGIINELPDTTFVTHEIMVKAFGDKVPQKKDEPAEHKNAGVDHKEIIEKRDFHLITPQVAKEIWDDFASENKNTPSIL